MDHSVAYQIILVSDVKNDWERKESVLQRPSERPDYGRYYIYILVLKLESRITRRFSFLHNMYCFLLPFAFEFKYSHNWRSVILFHNFSAFNKILNSWQTKQAQILLVFIYSASYFSLSHAPPASKIHNWDTKTPSCPGLSSFTFEKKKLFFRKETSWAVFCLGSRWSCGEVRLKLQEAGKALVLKQSPTLYFSFANLLCDGLGADSDPSRITDVMWPKHCGQCGWS